MSEARARAENETLAIPAALRALVDDRDGFHCRVCGKFLGDRRAHHHIVYGGDHTGMGGRRLHAFDNIITVCWLPGDPVAGAQSCHELVHSAKDVWQPLLLEVVHQPGVTALQLKRWQDRKARRL